MSTSIQIRAVRTFCRKATRAAHRWRAPALVLLLATAAGAHAEQVVLAPVRDNTIFSDSLNGSNARGDIFVGRNAGASRRRGLLAFDLSAIPAGAKIDSVSLRMTVQDARAGTFAVALHRLTRDWGEGTSSGAGPGGGQPGTATPNDATWQFNFFNSSSWSAPGGDFVAGPSASSAVASSGSPTWSGAGMVADVQAWHDGAAGNFGWILSGEENISSSVRSFASREDGAAGPRLTIDYTAGQPNTAATAESPAAGSVQSGVGLIRGWACEAQQVSIAIDGSDRIPIAWGTSRADTQGVCGDANNGYGMVIAWGLLGSGTHRLQTFVDDAPIGDVEFEVVTIGSEFETGLSGEYVLEDFPAPGDAVRVTWSEADQNFIVTGVDTGEGFAGVGENFVDTSPDGRFPAAEQQVGGAMHESPAQHTVQSGVGLIRGWACAAQQVSIAIDGGAPIRIAYGTSREDTRGVCGNANTGYGMVIAWGLLGNGVHHLQTFIDGVEIANVEFEVISIGSEFETGLAGEYRLPGFPGTEDSVDIRWSEPDQNFLIVRFNDASPQGAIPPGENAWDY